MDVVVPDLGDFADVEVIEVLVKPGDVVAPEDPLITLETEKAAMDVPSPAAGRVEEIKVGVGDTVSAGDVIVILAAEDADTEAGGETDTAGDDDGEQADAEAPSEDSGGEDKTVRQPRPSPVASEPVPVRVPDLGDFSDVEVIDVLVAEGDEVELEQGLITLETEKATMDVPSPLAGKVTSLDVKVGDRVNAGSAIMMLAPSAAPEDGGESQGEADAKGEAKTEAKAGAKPAGSSAAPVSRPTEPARRPPPIDEASFSKAHASPSVRKLARELGVDLGRVQGSGRKGRVTADDVKAYVKAFLQGGGAQAAALPSLPEVDFAKFGPVEREPLTRIQKISGARLHASWVNIPHVTQHDEADITELEQTRQSLKEQARERGIKLTPLAFIMRACVLTLAEFPRFRSSLDPAGDELVVKQYMHVGFAVDTPKGLVVPVIRDADKKDIYELANALSELSERAREGKLKAADIQGGVFTISSLGGIGGRFFTPVINAPEVAILGVSKHYFRPHWSGTEFLPRLTLPLSLAYDHRVIDGAEGVRFTTRLSETLGEVDRLVEAIP